MSEHNGISVIGPLADISGQTNPVPTRTAIDVIGNELPPLAAIPPGGRRTDVDPAPSVARPGAICHSFNLDFYDRIHIVPATISLGNLTQQKSAEVTIFNAHENSVYLTDIRETNTSGLALEALTLPFELKGISVINLRVIAYLNGPVAINARFVFVFSDGAELALRITGTRIVTFTMAPNWRGPMAETLAWSTDILISRDGSEQRISMLNQPRWRMDYLTTQADNIISRLDSLLAGWGARRYALPIWWLKTRLDSPVRPGDEFVYCNPAYFSDLAVIWSDEIHAETVEIAEIKADGLKLAFPASNNYQAGFCIPARLCFIQDDTVQIDSQTGRLMEIALSFESQEPDSSVIPLEFGDKYEDIQIVPYKHNWTEAFRRSLERNLRNYDQGIGLRSRLDVWGYPKDVFYLNNILLGDRAEIDEFKAWLAGLRGRARPFYWRLDEDHLRLAASITTGDTSLIVDNDIFGFMASGLAARKVLAIKTYDGPVYAEIAGYREGGVLLTARPFARSIAKENATNISFLILVRLDNDEITIEYQTDSIATASLVFRGATA